MAGLVWLGAALLPSAQLLIRRHTAGLLLESGHTHEPKCASIHPFINEEKKDICGTYFEEQNSYLYVMDLRHVMGSDYSPYDDLYGDIFLLLELRSLLDFCQSTSVQQERPQLRRKQSIGNPGEQCALRS